MIDPGEHPQPYDPISCERYSALELAIMHRANLDLVWVDENVYHRRRVFPLDLATRAGVEYLECRDESGVRLTLRLDALRYVTPV